MLIGKIEKIIIDCKRRFQSKVSSPFGNFYVYFDVDQEFEKYVDLDVFDAFLVAVLLRAMRNGEDITINGAVSERLLYNIKNSLMPIQAGILPDLKCVEIKTLGVRTKVDPVFGAVATGFSGGVDSFYTIAYHLTPLVEQKFKINYLLYNCHGSQKAKKLAEDRYELAKKFSIYSKIPLVRVDTNINDFSPIKYQESHNFRHISSVLLLQNLFGKYYYSSGYSFSECHLTVANSSAYSDPGTIHLFSTEKTEFLGFGGHASRPEKTRYICNYEPTSKFLNVCVSYQPGAQNCSVCRKCCRTLVTLDAYGEIYRYSKVFNIKKFNKVKNRYLFKVLRNKKNKSNKELIVLFRDRKYKIPVTVLFFSMIFNVLFPISLEKIIDKFIRSTKRYFKKTPNTLE